MTRATHQEDAPVAPPGLPDRAISFEPDGFAHPTQIGVDQEFALAVLVRVKVSDRPGSPHLLTQRVSHRRATTA
jgi:hypothetical protein